MTVNFRLLVVGGYGTFGGRLVELLEDDPRLTILVAGRSFDAARSYCNRRTAAAATLIPTAFDRITSTASAIAALQVAVVVDASGPFQAYGARCYSLIERCIESGVNYLDLADGTDFVAGIAQFDEAARKAGVYVLSGVSSFPVLTAAVVRQLTENVARVTSICGGIAPSPYAGVGLNVIRAVASYAGKPIWLKRSVPLRSTRFSLVDVPDLRILAELWPDASDVWMGAGPVPALLHWLLSGFAWLARLRLMPSLLGLAATLHVVTNHARWGEHRGGMFVVIKGELADGVAVRREWHLVAEGRDGPLVPSMAVAAIVLKTFSGEVPRPGARTAISDVNLSDYESLFARRTIAAGTRHREPREDGPLFQRLLGDAWDRLPPSIRELHSPTSVANYTGRCSVTAATNPIARAVAALVGFPEGGNDLSIKVTLSVEGAGERWVRTVGTRTFSSKQSLPTGRSAGLLRERFGPVAVDMALVIEAALEVRHSPLDALRHSATAQPGATNGRNRNRRRGRTLSL